MVKIKIQGKTKYSKEWVFEFVPTTEELFDAFVSWDKARRKEEQERKK